MAFDVLDHAGCGQSLAVHSWQRLEQRLATDLAAIPLAVNLDDHPLTVHWGVNVGLPLASVAIEGAMTGGASRGRYAAFGFDLVMVAHVLRGHCAQVG